VSNKEENSLFINISFLDKRYQMYKYF